jgi:thymidylate synthase
MLSNITKSLYDHEEKQYLSIVKDICETGDKIHGRNGYTLSKNGASMYFCLRDNKLPVLTTKKMAIKTCVKELLWFISGDTNNNTLVRQNVHIWDGNGSKDFLESRGLSYEENDLGPVYGHQWRHFNAPYVDCHTDYTGQGHDQLGYIINSLKHPDDKYSRRLILSAWNPCQLDEMALPPCHLLVQFNVNSKDELSCSLYQRSGDMGLGVPFNILSYCVLTHLLAKHCGLKAGEFIHHIGNAHVYDDHVDNLLEQTTREPLKFPTIHIDSIKDNINDYSIEDIHIENYTHLSPVKLNMRK